MTDRELLKFAAKAAGMDVLPHPSSKYSPRLLFIHNGCNWNPLNYDSDALRLAVKLKIPLQFPDWADVAKAWGLKYADRPCDEPFGSDPYAATRKAIVRAAAEIGRAMQ